MKRPLLAAAAAFIAWILVASVLNLVLRATLNGYAAAEPHMHFTPVMLLARLAIAALASLSAGAAIGWIAPLSLRTSWVFGAILLALFVPEHLRLWQRFPVWYHLTFLVTLVPLVMLGTLMARAHRSATQLGVRPGASA
jgi:hypothetical protein